MLKKIFSTAVLSICLTCAYAQTELAPEQIDAPVVECVGDCDHCGNCTEYVESEAVNSTETNTVAVSETARKMRQLEKANNIKENDSFGGSLTIISMTIVILALILLSILFQCFGKISQSLIRSRKQKVQESKGKEVDTEDKSIATGETIAAIAMALAEHSGQGHDIEDTILTIHQIKKSYSPWNSKIYNLRTQPELHRNSR